MYRIMAEDLDGDIYVMRICRLLIKDVIEEILRKRYGPSVNGKYVDSIGRTFWVEHVKEEADEQSGNV